MRWRVVVMGGEACRLEVAGALQELAAEVLRCDASGFDQAAKLAPDLLVLELPCGAGALPLLDALRGESALREVPVVALSGEGLFSVMQAAFEHGADEFLFRPFDSRELVARVRALLRRRTGSEPGSSPAGALRFRRSWRQVYAGGRNCELTRMEFEILDMLRREKGRTLTRETLLRYLWGGAQGLKTRALDMHISNLRRKLGCYSRCVKTVPGQGYRFVDYVPEPQRQTVPGSVL